MCISFDELPDEQQKTVKAIFSDPPPDILWLNALALFEVLGNESQIINGCLCVELNFHPEMRRAVFPYSGEKGCLSRYVIRNLRTYLRGVGVEPD